QIRNVPNSCDRHRNDQSLGCVLEARWMLPDTSSNSKPDHGYACKSKQPFRQQAKAAHDSEPTARCAQFKGVSSNEKCPSRCDECREPVVEDGFSRHPYQVRSQQA